jgi:hypothetical protein
MMKPRSRILTGVLPSRGPPFFWSSAVALGALAFSTGSAEAQAICSAPHSSPTMAQSGSLTTLPSGAGWFQVAGYGQQAERFFGPRGSRQPFLADSEFTTRSVFMTGAVGVITGLELWAQVPFHRLQVNSAAGSSTSAGVGDIRAAVRISPEIVGLEAPFAIRFGAKIPGSNFPVDATVLPLTEGQRDWEVALESGTSLAGLGVYTMGWIAFRWREENLKTDRHPGDEFYAHLAVGGTVAGVALELAADGLWGNAPLAQGFLLEGDKRQLIQLQPTIGFQAGPGRLEANVQIPLSGQNLPIGTGFSLGYRVSWGLLPDPSATLADFLGG